jgi:hypothetical protein
MLELPTAGGYRMNRILIGSISLLLPLLCSGLQQKPPNASTESEIDGTITPHLVSDRNAYFALLITLSVDEPDRSFNRRAFAFETAIPGKESDIVFSAADKFRTVFVEVMNKSSILKHSSPRPFPPDVLEKFDALYAQGWAGVDEASKSIEAGLSKDSLSKLREYLYSNIKAHMVVSSGSRGGNH